ncbi:MAG: hypothetical protein IKY23_04145 [Lachnospiraceae bacterium]|nr:hypothetical protein [Lachnospiraceae bacterium]
MKYRNAADIFPVDLLNEIQKYASGELIYIPQSNERRDWGSNSGAKAFYTERNSQIRWEYHENRKKISELATEYGLSTDTIRRILYK